MTENEQTVLAVAKSIGPDVRAPQITLKTNLTGRQVKRALKALARRGWMRRIGLVDRGHGQQWVWAIGSGK